MPQQKMENEENNAATHEIGNQNEMLRKVVRRFPHTKRFSESLDREIKEIEAADKRFSVPRRKIGRLSSLKYVEQWEDLIDKLTNERTEEENNNNADVSEFKPVLVPKRIELFDSKKKNEKRVSSTAMDFLDSPENADSGFVVDVEVNRSATDLENEYFVKVKQNETHSPQEDGGAETGAESNVTAEENMDECENKTLKRMIIKITLTKNESSTDQEEAKDEETFSSLVENRPISTVLDLIEEEDEEAEEQENVDDDVIMTLGQKASSEKNVDILSNQSDDVPLCQRLDRISLDSKDERAFNYLVDNCNCMECRTIRKVRTEENLSRDVSEEELTTRGLKQINGGLCRKSLSHDDLQMMQLSSYDFWSTKSLSNLNQCKSANGSVYRPLVNRNMSNLELRGNKFGAKPRIVDVVLKKKKIP